MSLHKEISFEEEVANTSAKTADSTPKGNWWRGQLVRIEEAKIPTRYQFNMISPKSYNVFFQKLRDGGVIGFRSELDVAMTKAAKAGS